VALRLHEVGLTQRSSPKRNWGKRKGKRDPTKVWNAIEGREEFRRESKRGGNI
jgi:hypothetical protein